MPRLGPIRFPQLEVGLARRRGGARHEGEPPTPWPKFDEGQLVPPRQAVERDAVEAEVPHDAGPVDDLRPLAVGRVRERHEGRLGAAEPPEPPVGGEWAVGSVMVVTTG